MSAKIASWLAIPRVLCAHWFDRMNSLFSRHEALGKWYNPVLLDPETVAAFACSPKSRRFVRRTFARLSQDAYSRYITAFRGEGEKKFGADWRYLDIVDVVAAV